MPQAVASQRAPASGSGHFQRVSGILRQNLHPFHFSLRVSACLGEDGNRPALDSVAGGTWRRPCGSLVSVSSLQPRSLAKAAEADILTLKVELRNDARAPRDSLEAARQLVDYVYGRVNVRIVWVREDPHVTVILKRQASAELKRRAQDAMGLTPASETARGRLSFVFINRVNEVSAGYSTAHSVVLGAAIAHELGHWLLSNEHTATGLMQRYFNQADFCAAREGRLLFTDQQSELIRLNVIARHSSSPGATR